MSYKFNLPDYDELNERQKKAVTDEGSVAITGGPGTGKSVVTVWRHLINYRRKRRTSVLLTYTKSLQYFLTNSIKSSADKENDTQLKQAIYNASNNVSLANSWTRQEFDEILIDEAQDLPENQIDNNWNKGYLNYITKDAKMVSYGADDKQIVYAERATTEKRLSELYPEAKPHKLFQNYRNTFCILNFAKHSLDFAIPTDTLDRLKEENPGREPILKITNDATKQNEVILDIIKDFNDGETNIAILLFFENQFDNISAFLKSKNIEFSWFNNKRGEFSNIENIHVTTFKSSKGLEFDVVIIPEFDGYKRLINNPNYNVNAEDYYVAFTRARRNLFLIANNDVSISMDVLKREKF